ncbi:hypothetical protein M3226_02685 [Neobacillus cucumis]|uniref:hypothetical protein n=1 Tax=Neobacillus cucumis TaxID=1740721 RepID=UPI00203F04F5|nr:hypothetical protein [Neobacillus cucumis]MCM3724608.1 hypothetical protein [Neobacillus cucumis]
MERIEFVQTLKGEIHGSPGCYTKTTEKKGEGFSPYNLHNIKWGQVDVEESRMRIVLDLFPGRYSVENLEEYLGLKLKEKRKRITGFHFDQTEQIKPPNHDAVVISLYPDFFQSGNYSITKILDFVKKAVKESSFKTNYPSKTRK